MKASSQGDIVRRASIIITIGGLLVSVNATADQVINDDLIVQGRYCVGFDCVNDEVFNAETIRVKENNTRIRFHDTTVLGDVLGQSWNISANDSTNGGDTYLNVELKSLLADFILLSDGTAPLYDCTDLFACQLNNPPACPIVGVIPAGEPVTDAFCNPLPPTHTVKSMLKLITDNIRTVMVVEDGVAIGYESDTVTGAVSVGRADLTRRIANVAAGIGATDLLITKTLSDYVPFEQQVAMVDDLNQQLNMIDTELDDIDAIIENAEVNAIMFNDVPTDYWAVSFIKTLAARGITAGCGNDNYCPDDAVTRAQMAVFLERGMRGAGYTPPAATGNTFLDVGAGDFAASFIEQLFLDGITAGCGGNNYCPQDEVTRAQMAVFLLRAKHGAGYSPPPPTGVFDDVDLAYWAVAWIEQLAAEAITAGCGGGNYCPDNPVTRAQMAVFLVRTFEL